MFREGITALQENLTELKLTAGNLADNLAFMKASQEAQMKESERLEILRWLRIDGIESDGKYREALSQRQADTGSWILESEAFLEWSRDEAACLWLYGIAGCGKTVLAYVNCPFLICSNFFQCYFGQSFSTNNF